MMHLQKYLFLGGLIIFLPLIAAGMDTEPSDVPSTRNMNLLTWKEFQAWVPDKIDTGWRI
jgi:hypothetical protein